MIFELLILPLSIILVILVAFVYYLLVFYPIKNKKNLELVTNVKDGSHLPTSSSSSPFMGDLRAMIKDATGWVHSELPKNGMVRTLFALKWRVSMSDPKYIHAIHSKSEENYSRNFSDGAFMERIFGKSIIAVTGEEWKRQHRILQKAFVTSNLNKFIPLMGESTVSTCFEKIDKEMKQNGYVNVGDLFAFLAVELIVRAGFDSDPKQTEQLVLLFQSILSQSSNIMWRIPYINKMRFIPKVVEMDQVFKDFNDISQSLINERKKKMSDLKDSTLETRYLVDLLLEARDDETQTFLTEFELMSNVHTFLIAGSETTANTIGWFLHNIITYPQIYERVQKEIDEVVPDNLSELSVQHLNKLDYFNHVVNETLRWSPSIMNCPGRILLKDMLVGDWNCREGQTMTTCILATHLSPENYENPETFDPDRWIEEKKEKTNDEDYEAPRDLTKIYKFVPFGVGRRVCIGKNFAQLEIKVVLCCVLKKYKVSACSQTGSLPKPRKFNPPILTPEGGLRLAFHKR